MSYTVAAGQRRYKLGETQYIEAVLQNIALILETPQGTIPMYRDFGLPIDALDLPMPAAKVRLSVAIKEAVEQFEPRAEIVSIRYDEAAAASGRLVPIVEVNIKDA